MLKINIVVNEKKCVGCRICELACSFEKNREFNPENSTIKITFNEDASLNVELRADCTCVSKNKPLCVELCPQNAIRFFNN